MLLFIYSLIFFLQVFEVVDDISGSQVTFQCFSNHILLMQSALKVSSTLHVVYIPAFIVYALLQFAQELPFHANIALFYSVLKI